ncbi:MAG TPA: M42 family metallopeptidase [Acidobacteriaceae bacterium]|nr:M42 family metallopeptidase [Acidobacteriaceae bacterium]
MRHHLRTLLPLGLAVSALLAAPSLLPAQQSDPTVQLLQRLADAPGPPGYEDPVRAIMVAAMKPLSVTPLRYDGMGSVVAQLGTTGPRIMVDAHMDELGGMVRRIAPNGQLTMQMLGGWLDQALVDQRWIILGSKGPVEAVTGIRDIHVITPAERTAVIPRDSVFLDTGARTPAEVASLGIEPGDPVVPDSPFKVLAGNNYLGKAWDDRIGCAVLLEAMQRLVKLPHSNQVFFVATTQEEIGLRGARTAANLVRPDLGLALEGGIANDQGGHPEETQAHLGGGPGIFLYDSSAIPNRKLVRFVEDTAKSNSIPLQLDLVQGYGDDSAEMQESGTGAPTLNIVTPVRYTHAHNGVVNRADFDRTVDLLVDLLQHLDGPTVDRIRDFTPAP